VIKKEGGPRKDKFIVGGRAYLKKRLYLLSKELPCPEKQPYKGGGREGTEFTERAKD